MDSPLQELFHGLLQPHPQDRLTAAQALQNNWVRPTHPARQVLPPVLPPIVDHPSSTSPGIRRHFGLGVMKGLLGEKYVKGQ